MDSALKVQLEFAEDMVIDIPKDYDIMADIIALLIESDEMELKSLLRAICSALPSEIAPKMLLPLFKRINVISSGGIAKKWEATGLNISELISGASDKDMKDLENVLGVSVHPSSGMGLTPAELTKRFHQALEKSGDDRDKALSDVIHQAGDDKKTAARACATALIRFCVQKGSGFDKEKVEKKLASIPEPIKELFATSPDLQMNALYALQVVMHELEWNPKDVTTSIINWFYDSELVEEEVLVNWSKKDPNHEPIGYHMTVQQAESWLKWLESS